MKKTNNLTENVKVRMTKEEKQAIRNSALGMNNTSNSVIKIQRIMEQNRICNHIATMELPQNIKNQILEEVSNLD